MKATILMVDNDADDREIFCEVVSMISASNICYAFGGGQDALRHLSEGKISVPDIIFLDINMPVMSGWDCLSLLKKNEQLSNIPVYMYSTSSLPDEAKKAEQLGAAGYYCKPADIMELQKALETLILQVRQAPSDGTRPVKGLVRFQPRVM
ncbi:MAG: response regulator [Chitinophagaceae bacterium]|nr:MAG: response regulator [Chitinophagaceae bacterium]